MHWLGICVLCFIIGRAVQRWCDNAPDLEREIYEAGYREGLRVRTIRGTGYQTDWETFAYTKAEMAELARSILTRGDSNAPANV